MTPDLLKTLCSATVYDLAQPYYPGMPHHPNHPPYLFGLTKKHGDFVAPAGTSSAADAITMSGHTGTHMDALCHFSRNGKLHGGIPADTAQSYDRGISQHSVDTIAPVLRRGVLLDVAGHEGVDALPADFEITPEHLKAVERAERVDIQAGDVVLLRTGWGRFWNDPSQFVSQVRGPGPAESGAHWLSRAGVFAAGSDTLAFELAPAPNMPVHVHLLVESGIHIIECLNLEELAARRVYEFVFVASPLKFRGGTGSPIRPVAIA